MCHWFQEPHEQHEFLTHLVWIWLRHSVYIWYISSGCDRFSRCDIVSWVNVPLISRTTQTWCLARADILYHFNQFVGHASRAFQNRRNVTIVTVILAKWRNHLAIMCRIWTFFVACGANLPKFSGMSRQNWEVSETIFSSGASRVTVPDELIEMVQYWIKLRLGPYVFDHTCGLYIAIYCLQFGCCLFSYINIGFHVPLSWISLTKVKMIYSLSRAGHWHGRA
jgi:hypothetical protein